MTSGNCLKVLYVARYLGITHDWVEVSSLDGATRTDAFRARNRFAQVPVIERDDGGYLAQSNAIIRYLAAGSKLLPDDPWAAAKVDEWLFWEQYSHEPYIAVCRSAMVYRGKTADEREAWRVERGEAALDVMNAYLADSDWLANDRFSVADIALLAYTRMAGDGGFDLVPRRHVGRWIGRCEAALSLNRGPGL